MVLEVAALLQLVHHFWNNPGHRLHRYYTPVMAGIQGTPDAPMQFTSEVMRHAIATVEHLQEVRVLMMPDYDVIRRKLYPHHEAILHGIDGCGFGAVMGGADGADPCAEVLPPRSKTVDDLVG